MDKSSEFLFIIVFDMTQNDLRILKMYTIQYAFQLHVTK